MRHGSEVGWSGSRHGQHSSAARTRSRRVTSHLDGSEEVPAGLRAFPDLALQPVDYEEAASCYNRCRAKGIQGSNTDFLMCAVALRHHLAIYTTDKDFSHYARHLSVRLHLPRR